MAKIAMEMAARMSDFNVRINDKQILIDTALQQIIADVEYGDLTAIEELLNVVPEANIKAFLSEVDPKGK